MGQPSELIIKAFSSLENLTQLYLLGHLSKSLDWYQIPSGLKVLTLSVSQLDEDPMPTLSKLSSLIVLRLLASSYVGKEPSFPLISENISAFSILSSPLLQQKLLCLSKPRVSD
ncbi:hypothetical protein L6452_13956 [Arctium lappa]|uniref:Uncharacterized protein n=1 Tax=Arctium lappa TaxID=4217 RepID=A0ACB9CJR9_ARCLA|nr:hypothetical protein L6452_13956 [Arctium lappa]